MPTYHTGPGGVWVQDVDQPASTEVPRTPGNERIYKPIGNTITPNSSSDQTWQIKAAIPADADEVALIFFHHDNQNALTGVRACYAATESFYPHSTTDDKFHPFVNGAGKRTLDDTLTIWGWRSMTWSGANSPTLAQPAAVGGTALLSNVPSVATSDFGPLPPGVLPSAADIAAGGSAAFRYVLFRVYVPGAIGNKYAFSAFAPSTSSTTLNNGWVTRFSQSGGDIVTTAINTSTGDYTNWLPVAIVYRSRSRGRNVAFCGDSLTQGQGATVTDEGMAPWAVRACTLVDRGLRWSPINLGCSSQTQATFLAAAQSALPVLKPHMAAFQCGSPNDGPFTTLLSMQQYTVAALGRVHEFLKTCSSNSITPVLETWAPCAVATIASSALGLTIDAERRAHNDRIRAICVAGGAKLFDYDALITDGGTVDAFGVFRIRAALTSDGTHPNEAGSKILAAAFTALL